MVPNINAERRKEREGGKEGSQVPTSVALDPQSPLSSHQTIKKVVCKSWFYGVNQLSIIPLKIYIMKYVTSFLKQVHGNQVLKTIFFVYI